MRRPDEDQLPDDDSVGAGSVGAGFGGVDADDLVDGYGDGFDDDYGDGFDDDDSDRTYDDEDRSDSTVDDHGSGSGMTDEEAEEILVDVLEDDYGSEADEVVEDLQESTGLSATELLEDLTGMDIDGSGSRSTGYEEDESFELVSDGGPSSLSFDGTDSDLDLPTESDFDLNGDGHVDRGDMAEAAHPFDFDVSD